MMTKKLSAILWQLFMSAMLLLAAGTATAAGNVIPAGENSVWTVYAFGNAQAVADTFRALANFTSSGLFQSIVSMIAVIGVIVVGASSGFSSAMGKKFISYIVGVYLICYVFFGIANDGPLVANVEVVDTVDSTWKAPVTVPAVVGIPAALISSAGHEITRQLEASFPIPEEMKMSNGAPFNLASSLLSDASQARISDPNLASSLAYYVQDCFIPAVARGDLTATTLTQSTDFINDIRWDSPSVMVMTTLGGSVTSGSGSSTYQAGENNLVTCANAWSLINTNINNSSVGAASFLQNASAWAKTPALNVVNSAADSIAQWASNNGVTDGGALVKQSAVLATFSGAFKQAAAATGNSDFLTGLNIAQAQQQQTNGWIMGAEVFNRSMGYIYAILQVFIYAATPLVLAAALVPGLGFALLKNFGQLLLWMAIWQPMLSIVNFIVLSMQQADLGGALASGSGQFGFTLTNMGIISQKTANMRAAAMFIGTMVPALAWGLVKGSVDFSRFISEAAGDRMAQSAALSMTTGNYSLNQASMDSFTANKHSIGATGDWGAGFSNAGGIGAINSKNEMGGNLNGAFAQAPNVNTGKNLATNTGGTASDTSNANTGGSRAETGGNSAASAEAGGHGVNTAQGVSAGRQTSLEVGAGTGVHPLGTPSRGGGSPGGGGYMPGQQTPAGMPPAKANSGEPGMVKKLVDDVRNNTMVTARGSMSGNEQNSAQSAQTGNRSNTGTLTDTGAITFTDNEAAGNAKNAGTSHGYSKGSSLNVTGVSSLADRVAALDAVRQEGRSRMGHYASGPAMVGEREGPTLTSTLAGDMTRDSSSAEAVANDVAREQNSIATEKRGYDEKADALKAAAEEKRKKAEQDAAADIHKGQERINQQTKLAHTGAGAGLGQEVRENANDALNTLHTAAAPLMKPAIDMAHRVEAAATPYVDSAKQFVNEHKDEFIPPTTQTAGSPNTKLVP